MAFIIVPESNVDRTKFDNCKYRSENEQEYITQHCCSSKKKAMGFVCSKLLIKGLIPLQCCNCDLYEYKNIERN